MCNTDVEDTNFSQINWIKVCGVNLCDKISVRKIMIVLIGLD